MLKCQQKKLPRQGAVKVIDGREICNMNSVEGRRIYEQRRYEMECRQGFKCAICTRTAGSSMQFDHQGGRGFSGATRDDRIEIDGDWINAALCSNCNSWKGSRRYKRIEGVYQEVKKLKEIAA